jgi:hypothetical protein
MGKHLFTETHDRPGPGFSRNYDLNHLPNGVYMMKFTSGEQSVMKKLIITR